MRSVGDVLIADPACHRVILKDSGEKNGALLMAGVAPVTDRICCSEEARQFFRPIFAENGLAHPITGRGALNLDNDPATTDVAVGLYER